MVAEIFNAREALDSIVDNSSQSGGIGEIKQDDFCVRMALDDIQTLLIGLLQQTVVAINNLDELSFGHA